MGWPDGPLDRRMEGPKAFSFSSSRRAGQSVSRSDGKRQKIFEFYDFANLFLTKGEWKLDEVVEDPSKRQTKASRLAKAE